MLMLPSKVMPYLLRLAAPLMDSLIVQSPESRDGVVFGNYDDFPKQKFGLIAGTTNHTSRPEALIDVLEICLFNL